MSYDPGPKSKEIFSQAKSFIPGGVNSPVRAFGSVGVEPFVVARGEGAYLVDVDGNRYLDYINSWGPLVLGHADPHVVEILQEQVTRGTSYGACCEAELALAELVVEQVPSVEMLRFVNSGTEAGMSVLRLARGFTGRNKIVKFKGCYHGHTDQFLVKAGSGVATFNLPGTSGVTQDTIKDTLLADFNSLQSVATLFEQHQDQIAAIILEPVTGNAGFIMPEAGFLEGLRDLCDGTNTLLIFDEVMTGFRVALDCAQGHFNVSPDLTMLGKVIGGGLPVGAYGGRKDIMEHVAPVGPVYQAGTLSGNPLAMVAGHATLSKWSSDGRFERAEKYAASLVQAFREISNSYNIPVWADSCGAMFGFFFHEGPVINYEQAQSSNQQTFNEFFKECLARGVYFAQSPFEAGFISAAHGEDEFQHTVNVLDEVFAIIGRKQ